MPRGRPPLTWQHYELVRRAADDVLPEHYLDLPPGCIQTTRSTRGGTGQAHGSYFWMPYPTPDTYTKFNSLLSAWGASYTPRPPALPAGATIVSNGNAFTYVAVDGKRTTSKKACWAATPPPTPSTLPLPPSDALSSAGAVPSPQACCK